MAVRIEQYEQQVATPGGKVAGAEGRVGGSFRLDLEGFGAGLEGIAQATQEAEANNARADLASREPAAQLAFTNELTRLQREWAPGMAPIAQQMGDYIGKYAEETAKQMPSAIGRELVSARADEMRLKYMLDGAAFQTKAETDHRVGIYGQTYADVSSLAARNPSQLGELLTPINATVMADSQLTTAERAEMVRKNSTDVANQVAKVMAESAPERVMGYTGTLLGIANPTLKISISDGGDVVAAIVKRESGGRMHDGAGNILRGPAITTRDGKTIHAYGKYQMLEDTARSTAAQLGVPWNRELFMRSRTGDPRLDAEAAQYHDLLGQAYIERQSAEFGGDPMLIAAAHNMGPAATKGWAAGRPYQTQSGKWWHPKGPKDMAALPEETRKYIQGLGTVDESPAVPGVDPRSEEGLAFRLLDPQQLLAVRSAAESTLAAQQRERDAQLAMERDLFTQRVQDLETAAKHGEPITLPTDGELTTFFGPAKASLTKQRLLDYQQMAGALKALPGASNAELKAMAAMPNPEGAVDRENRQFVRDTLAERAQATLATRKADPGQAALDSSPTVRAAYADWQEAAGAFYAAGNQTTSEQFAAVNAAQKAYVDASFSQQRQWGILEPKLPADVVTQIADGFRVQVAQNPAMAAARFAALPAQLGSYDALQQVGTKTGPLGWFAMEQVPPQVLRTLQQASAMKPEEVASLLPGGIKPAEVKTAVSAAFAPLLTTFALPGPDGSGDNATATRYYNAGVALANQYLISGQASSSKTAAAMAYQAIYADRETVVDGVRIPLSLGPEQVSEGLRRRKINLPEADLFVAAPSPGLDTAETRERIARTVRERGRWVTNETGTGAYLMLAGKPVLDARGHPIAAAFAEVVKEERPLGERQREAARLESMARGLK